MHLWITFSEVEGTLVALFLLVNFASPQSDVPRHFDPGTITQLSKSLEAINAVGKFLVGINRKPDQKFSQNIPNAIYTLTEQMLGKNVAENLAPLVRTVLPDINRVREDKVNNRSCTTIDGDKGMCMNLDECPQLLLNPDHLRRSLCFKHLFEPGVCCPITAAISTQLKPVPPTKIFTVKESSSSTPRPTLTTRAPYITTHQPLHTLPVNVTTLESQECGQPELPKFRVIGGEEALPGRWPWMAAIFLHGTRRIEFWCGGTLISPRHILTAAHCTRDSQQRPFSPRQLSVRLGDVDLQRSDEPSAPVTYKVSAIRAHEEFTRIGYYNDIALLVLDNAVQRSKYVIPICMTADFGRSSLAGRSATVVGWGTTYYGGKESTIQRQAELPIWRNEDCNNAYFQPITQNFICAGYAEGGVDACQGDSGGPLMLQEDEKWIQIGIVSFGNKCGEPGYPGVYTRVVQYLDWIKQNMVIR